MDDYKTAKFRSVLVAWIRREEGIVREFLIDGGEWSVSGGEHGIARKSEEIVAGVAEAELVVDSWPTDGTCEYGIAAEGDGFFQVFTDERYSGWGVTSCSHGLESDGSDVELGARSEWRALSVILSLWVSDGKRGEFFT